MVITRTLHTTWGVIQKNTNKTNATAPIKGLGTETPAVEPIKKQVNSHEIKLETQLKLKRNPVPYI